MLKIVKILAMLIILSLATNASATLISLTDKIIYDDIKGQYWFAGLQSSILMTMPEQIEFANNLSETFTDGFGDVITLDNWHIAQSNEFNLDTSYSPLDLKIAGFEWTSYVESQSTKDYSWSGRIDGVHLWVTNDPIRRSKWISLNYIEFTQGGSAWNKTEGFIRDDAGVSNLSAWIVSQGPNPVPEPGTMVLFGLGLLGLVGIRRKKKQATDG